MMNIIGAGMLPVEAMGDMSAMYKKGELYEVMVEDRMNPDARYFSFGLNGHLGEYPTNARIKLRGEEIQHLYNCVYESPIVQDSAGDFRRVVGKRVVCRFAITPTKWGAIPSDGVVLDTSGVKAETPPFFRQAPQNAQDGGERAASAEPQQDEDDAALQERINKLGGGPEADDMLAAREKELEFMNVTALREISREYGLKQGGSKAELIAMILQHEEKKLRGWEE